MPRQSSYRMSDDALLVYRHGRLMIYLVRQWRQRVSKKRLKQNCPWSYGKLACFVTNYLDINVMKHNRGNTATWSVTNIILEMFYTLTK